MPGSVGWGYDNSDHVGDGGVLSREALRISWWLILADVVCLWSLGGSRLMALRTGPELPYAYEKIPTNCLFRLIVAKR